MGCLKLHNTPYLKPTNFVDFKELTSKKSGKKACRHYELANHLGNVLAVVTDRKIPLDANSNNVVDGYRATILSSTDYSAFGAELDGRNFSSSSYRYGFQNQEKDNEIKGEGNSINFTYRMHDPRLGRFFAVDPLAGDFPWNSPYSFSENRVIDAIELEGAEHITLSVCKQTKDAMTIKIDAICVITFDLNSKILMVSVGTNALAINTQIHVPSGTVLDVNDFSASGGSLLPGEGFNSIPPAAKNNVSALPNTIENIVEIGSSIVKAGAAMAEIYNKLTFDPAQEKIASIIGGIASMLQSIPDYFDDTDDRVEFIFGTQIPTMAKDIYDECGNLIRIESYQGDWALGMKMFLDDSQNPNSGTSVLLRYTEQTKVSANASKPPCTAPVKNKTKSSTAKPKSSNKTTSQPKSTTTKTNKGNTGKQMVGVVGRKTTSKVGSTAPKSATKPSSVPMLRK